MRLLFGLFALAIVGIAFLVWRTIARSPKLDNLFNFSRREDTARDILARQSRAESDLTARGRTLGGRQRELSRELDSINRNKKDQ